MFSDSLLFGTCDGPVLIRVVALDQFGNIDLGENRNFQLVSNSTEYFSRNQTIYFLNGVAYANISSHLSYPIMVSLVADHTRQISFTSTLQIFFRPGSVIFFFVAAVVNLLLLSKKCFICVL